MTRPFVPVNEPLLNGNEEKYLVECIRTGWISSEGPFIARFEEGLAAKVGRKHGVAVCNGSVALDLAVAVLDISPGDEVIIPAHTIISCVAPIMRAGGVPVLVDCDQRTYNMNVNEVEALITPKTKAIMAVHIFGLPVDMDPLMRIAEKHRLSVIEDAAEMHGQSYKGRPCGSFGDVSTFSFYSNKHITTGEGGMVLTDDKVLADRLRSLRNLCFRPEQRFFHEELGWNYRMSNLQAAVGVAQLERLDEFVRIKREMGKKYTSLLKGTPGIQLPVECTADAQNIYWVYPVLLNDSVASDARVVMAKLNQYGVGSRPFFWSLSEQPVLMKKGFGAIGSCPVAESVARRGFYIPSGMALTDSQIEYVAQSVKDVMSELA